jgi:phage terminase large subunit-like protein
MIDLSTGTYSLGPLHADQHSWLLEYIGKCKTGEILIGHELMTMLDILLKHLEDPEIRFELAEAQKRIKFIETNCRHYEAPFAGKPFILTLRQKAYVEAKYSFKIYEPEIDRWVRLFQEFLMVIARKQGKTPFVAAMDLADFFCGPMGSKILCSSNDYEQAALMFDAINAMREESPVLEKVTRKNIKGIYFGNPKKVKKRGKFSYQNKGSIRKISSKTGAKEGRNISIGSVDEIHELLDNSSIMPIRQALSTQDEPIFEEITTEGFTNDGYLDGRIKEAREVLEWFQETGEVQNPRWLIWLHTQDSEAEIWQDEKSWVKSNPDLGVIKKWSFLRQMVEESKKNMATRAFVLAKDFNIKQNNAKAWLPPNLCELREIFDISTLRGCIGIGGVDLAETTDLVSARVMIMRPGDPKKYMLQMYFIPESKLDIKDDGKDYREWERQGLVTVSPGNDNDFSLITKWFIKIVKEYGIRIYKIGYDNALAKYWVKEMEDVFHDDRMVRLQQHRKTLSNPMNLLEADLRSELIVTNDNPIDEWCLKNTALDIDSSGLIMPVKVQGRRDKRIDGCLTMIFCEAVYQQYKSDFLKLVG